MYVTVTIPRDQSHGQDRTKQSDPNVKVGLTAVWQQRGELLLAGRAGRQLLTVASTAWCTADRRPVVCAQPGQIPTVVGSSGMQLLPGFRDSWGSRAAWQQACMDTDAVSLTHFHSSGKDLAQPGCGQGKACCFAMLSTPTTTSPLFLSLTLSRRSV
jgi:hypothetical protein